MRALAQYSGFVVCRDSRYRAQGERRFIVDEIARCQEANGGKWCFSIPEKYLLWLKRGKRTWAPHYVCHKTLSGLLDMYKYTANQKALTIICKAADWFSDYTCDISDQMMKEIMETETGGMTEFFADLYSITQDPSHWKLAQRYERKELFTLLEDGKNALANQHANTTIPEILGAARMYEVKKEERYRKLVERYWKLATDEAEMFVTGGQTCGEVWTSPHAHGARLSATNQEHCVVYNMMRLAEYLFRWTGEAMYADYWERNLYNGIFAQGFWQADEFEQIGGNSITPPYGYVAYYLPLHAGAQKKWGSATRDFWCCHNTLLQGNASFFQSLYYRDNNRIIVAQYQDSRMTFTIDDVPVTLKQTAVHTAGDLPPEFPNTRGGLAAITVTRCRVYWLREILPLHGILSH